MNELELTGRARTHVIDIADPRCTLHCEAAPAFLAMRAAAIEAGIELEPVSSFRDFDAQVRIWNEKFRGQRPLYDRDGVELVHATLSEGELLDAILCWSAAPGASRHHWGSEVDVIDRARLAPGVRFRLLPEEYFPGGMFAELSAWLDANMARFGFFRPYRTDRGGVSPEPWHLSYAPVSQAALAQLSVAALREALAASEIDGKSLLLERLTGIHARYVASVDSPPTPRSA
jgi:LAS superfamily LD-carboxypeptidase LdcB